MAIRDNEPYLTPQEAREQGKLWEPRETDVLGELDDPYARHSVQQSGGASQDVLDSWAGRDEYFGGAPGTEGSTDQSDRGRVVSTKRRLPGLGGGSGNVTFAQGGKEGLADQSMLDRLIAEILGPGFARLSNR